MKTVYWSILYKMLCLLLQAGAGIGRTSACHCTPGNSLQGRVLSQDCGRGAPHDAGLCDRRRLGREGPVFPVGSAWAGGISYHWSPGNPTLFCGYYGYISPCLPVLGAEDHYRVGSLFGHRLRVWRCDCRPRGVCIRHVDCDTLAYQLYTALRLWHTEQESALARTAERQSAPLRNPHMGDAVAQRGNFLCV